MTFINSKLMFLIGERNLILYNEHKKFVEKLMKKKSKKKKKGDEKL